MSTLGRSDHIHATSLGPQSTTTRTHAVRALVGAGVIGGFGTASAMWLAWFITHLPAIRLPIAPSGVLLLAILALGTAITARLAPAVPSNTTGPEASLGASRRPAVIVGALAGLIAAVINLMLLGSKIVEQPAIDPTQLDASQFASGQFASGQMASGPVASGPAGPSAAQGEAVGQLVPHAVLVVGGFLLLSAAAGAVAGLIARRRGVALDRPGPLATPRHRLAAMATIACCATAPLLFIGGLVTSTESGMAVPDWPGSYGANMFLYPIGLMAHPRIFLEHAHRLFGALVGVCTVATFVYALVAVGKGRSGLMMKLAALGLVVLVVTQGVLGGVRVTEINLFYALFHGVTAQIFFACLVAFAAVASPMHAAASPGDATRNAGRSARLWSFVLIGCLFLQLVLGAAYRHQGHVHALYTHAAFAIVAVVVAIVASFMMQRSDRDTREGVLMRRIGAWIIGTVAVQFMLGWVAFALVTTADERPGVPLYDEMAAAPDVPALEALVATLHQANGALLLALATLAAVWTLRMARSGRGEADSASTQAGLPA